MYTWYGCMNENLLRCPNCNNSDFKVVDKIRGPFRIVDYLLQCNICKQWFSGWAYDENRIVLPEVNSL